MAIAFLDDINLNDNQAENLVIQRIGTLPAGVEAKIVYDNGSNTIKYYNGTGWIELDGLGGLAGSGTVGTVPTFVTNTTTLGDSALETSGSGATQTFTFNTSGTTNFKGDIITTGNLSLDPVAGKGGLKDKDGDLGNNGQLLSSTGTATNWIDAPVSYTNWLLGPSGSTVDVNDGDNVRLRESSVLPGFLAISPATKSGTAITQDIGIFAKNMTNASPSDYSTEVLLWSPDTSATTWKINKTHIDDIPVSAWGNAVASINMNSNAIIGLPTPALPTMAANKAYVDASTVGNLVFQGGYNAATNTPDLDSSPSSNIKKGWTYVVTVAGSFFTEAVEVGDFLFAQSDAPTTLADWVTVQNNVGLATALTVGIGNVNVSTSTNNEGLSLSYSNGTGIVGFDIKNGLVAATALADGDGFAMFQGSAGAQGNKSITSQLMADYFRSKNSFAGTSSSGITHTFNHNLNSFDVMVQIYNNAISTQDTVYAETVRTSANQVVVTTASSANIRCLIQKIG